MRVPTTPERSLMMSKIRGKNTSPERRLRTLLFAKGFRYRLHLAKLPGSPDLVLRKHHAVIFVHGCFWHRHQGCRYTTTPKSNAEFWLQKLQENVARDSRNIHMLIDQGWRVAIVWECAIKHSLEDTIQNLESWLYGNKPFISLGNQLERT